MSAKFLFAQRVRSWKNGARTKKGETPLTAGQVRLARLNWLQSKEAKELLELFRLAIEEGDLSALARVQVTAIAELEVLRREAVNVIHEKGMMVQDEVIDSEGRVIGTRQRANPLLSHLENINEQLGLTASQLMISKKSRGEGAVNAATAVLQARRAMLLGADKSRLPPPPEDDDQEDQQQPN
jgi:hypothetical protein